MLLMCSNVTVFVLVFAFVLCFVHINQLVWRSTVFMLTKPLCFICFLKTLCCCKQNVLVAY